MQAEIVNTGSELLLGLVQNKHLAHLAGELAPLGIRVSRQVCVPDGPPVREAIADALARATVVIVTGGLGPTSDDVTREAAAELLGCPLREDTEILEAIRARFARRGLPMADRVAVQALVPSGARVLPNDSGTAPGLYFPPNLLQGREAQHLFLLPGPPRELNPMVRDHVLPILRAAFPAASGRECRIYRMTGIGESQVEARIGTKIEDRGDIEVGYCARPSEVDFRLIGPSAALDEVEPGVLAEAGEWIYSRGESLEHAVVNRLRSIRASLAVAESCTGGALADRITDVPGASEVFLAGFVTYANEAKRNTLGVPAGLLEAHGAVSEPVAAAMAEGAIRATSSRLALATTGIAGPGGGTHEKPTGTVFVALAAAEKTTTVCRFHFPVDRRTFKHMVTSAALDMLRRHLDGLPCDPGRGSALPHLG